MISGKQFLIQVLIAIALGVLIAACSPPPPLPTAASLPTSMPGTTVARTGAAVSANNGPAQNICTMLKAADVEAALGEPLGSSEPGTAADKAATCTFTGSSKQSKVVLTLRAPQSMDKIYADFQKSDPGNTQVSGIGDRAMNTSLGFFVAKGKTLIQVLVSGTKTSPPDSAQRLAKIIADRIP